MTVSVRELPPLRLSVSIETPSGKCYRWGSDEPRADDVYSGLSFSTIMPGGYEAMDARLPRKAALDYSDLERLSTIRIHGAGGELCGEYRLEKSPRESGTDRNISPQAVGWQAALDDDATATYLGVDRDLSHWGSACNARKESLYGTYDIVADPTTEADETDGNPTLRLLFTPPAAADAVVEALYDAGPGQTVSSIYSQWTSSIGAVPGAGYIGTTSTDDHAAEDVTADLIDADPDSATTTHTPTAAYRYGYLLLTTTTAHGNDDDHWMSHRKLSVWGPGVTKRGTAPDDGLYASDIIAAVVGEFAPVLNFSTGSNGTIQPSGFVIPQAEWRSPTTAGNIIKDANRFHIRDWAVWSDNGRPTFYYHDRGARGRTWRSRVGEAKLSETGPQVDKLFNGVLVTYNDVDGTQKTVGPTGSDANTESAQLLDSDPENPVNRLGIRRWATLDMGIVSTSAGATEVGWRFLQESKAYDTSGQATLQGHVTSDRGVVYPAFMVKAGDQIVFTDAADPRPRRIVKTSYDHDARTCSIDLDAPPEGMDALLERLGVVLVPIGL